jgi:phosphorylcholine metabolism protein LicD
VFSYNNHADNPYKMDFSKYELPIQNKAILLAMMEKIHDAFNKNNIKYFVDGGSLLGAIRDGGIIPYDDDIDIGVLDKDFPRVIPLLDVVFKDDPLKAFTERTSKDMIKVAVSGMWMKNNETGQIYGTPTIDIFKYTKAGNFVKLANLRDRRRFPNCYYLKNELYPLKEYKFNHITVLGANNPLGYLHRYYGKDCLTTYKIDMRKEENAREKDRDALEFSTNPA